MHPRGVYELRDFGMLEKRSADGEDFAERISEINEQFKGKLQQSNSSYNMRVYLRRKEKNYEVTLLDWI